VTLNAVRERNLPRHSSRADIGWHVSQRHGQRVAPAIFGFGVPLSDKIARYVTIAAGGHVCVLPLAPVIEGFPHDVTIRARIGVIAEVGGTLCIVECVERRAKWHRDEADRHRQVDRISAHDLRDCSCYWRRRKCRKRISDQFFPSDPRSCARGLDRVSRSFGKSHSVWVEYRTPVKRSDHGRTSKLNP